MIHQLFIKLADGCVLNLHYIYKTNRDESKQEAKEKNIPSYFMGMAALGCEKINTTDY